MARPIFTDKQFIELFQNSKSLVEFAEKYKIDLRSVKRRRRTIENKYKIALKKDNVNLKERCSINFE